MVVMVVLSWINKRIAHLLSCFSRFVYTVTESENEERVDPVTDLNGDACSILIKTTVASSAQK